MLQWKVENRFRVWSESLKVTDIPNKTHRYHVGGYDKGIYYEGDGSVIEFVVDTDVYKPKKIPKEFDGKIHSIYAEDEED